MFKKLSLNDIYSIFRLKILLLFNIDFNIRIFKNNSDFVFDWYGKLFCGVLDSMFLLNFCFFVWFFVILLCGFFLLN